MKYCPRCKKHKAVTDFYKNQSAKEKYINHISLHLLFFPRVHVSCKRRVGGGIEENNYMSTQLAKAEPGIVSKIKAEINHELGDAETLKSLLDTTFKGLDAPQMKRALLEGMLRGFPFEAFLKKDVYAIPYGQTFTLITSIDYSRKIGARGGVVGVDAPVYEMDGDRIISCSVTVHKRFPDGYVGGFTAQPDFKEYSTGKNLWASKPKTMIAKVAEMHALRKACPEELAQVYVEEEMAKREPVRTTAIDVEALQEAEQSLLECKDPELLNRVWADMGGDLKTKLKPIYEGQKAILEQEAKDII